MGVITSITGPIITARNIDNPRINDLVLIGEKGLYGEILTIQGNQSIIQVYEPTTGLKIGDKAISTHNPLTVELGPGLLNQVFDGLQRGLTTQPVFLKHAPIINRLNRDKKWHFTPLARKGDKISNGGIIGEVVEEGLKHKVMLPPNKKGVIKELREGDYTITEQLGVISTSKGDEELIMLQQWPVKKPRPVKQTLLPTKPLITGQRVIDALFPIPLGNTSTIPGPFGAGKTVLQQGFAKYAKADIKIFVGCGERGNEIADLIRNKQGRNNLFIVNTSNMPIIARESSIYTAATIGEYYRDMGYNVLLMADSLSRWAEALREVSATMNELPAEEGYPSYLPSRIAAFFERASRAVTLNNNTGSLTIISSVSPPSGDFSEPVTQYATNLASTSWFLDSELAYKRHFPAINWELSFSKHYNKLSEWWVKIDNEWKNNVLIIKQLLEEEAELQGLVKAIGFVSLSREQKIKITTTRIIHEGLLKQNAFNKVDKYCEPEKTALIISLITMFYKHLMNSESNIDEVINNQVITELMNIKNTELARIKSKQEEIIKRIKSL